MSTAIEPNCVHQIGETAGLIWHVLNEQGPQSVAKLAKEIEAPRDLILQAIGWLAREDKLEIEEGRRGRIVSLRQNGSGAG
jgi:hypothetical protein